MYFYWFFKKIKLKALLQLDFDILIEDFSIIC